MGQLLYAGAIHIVEQAKIDAARITQKSGNERRGAETALQQFSAALGTKRRLDAAGDNINAINENIGRNLDAAAAGTFQSRIAAAEEAGAHAAMAAAAGMGGSSVDVFNETVQLANAMREENASRAVRSDSVSASAQAGSVLKDAVASIDNNVYAANLDFKQYVDHKKPSTLGNLATLGIAAAATYFGGPKAGAAVISLREADIAASNGDFAGASSSLSSAANMGFSSFKETRAAGGHYWSSARMTGPKTK
jgi:hypothetical protein